LQIPTPLALTDAQLNAIIAASTPLPPDLRPAFLETCAREISGLPMVGDGSLHRLIMIVQRRYFKPPLETEEHDHGARRRGLGKYA
jgi:hypothetical protein